MDFLNTALSGVFADVFAGEFASLQPWAKASIGLALVALVAVVAGIVARIVLLKVVRRGREQWGSGWWHIALHDTVLRRVAKVVPSIVMQQAVYGVPHLQAPLANLLHNLAAAFTTYHLARAVMALLDALNHAHDNYDGPRASQTRTIKSYVQLGKLTVGIVALLLIVATVLDRSPLLLLSGLGAMSAVLMLVFKDTILSFVAGVQLASNDMLRVDDWIEMPSENADGAVIEINLHTVKVQNWDKTVTSIPTLKLMSASFKNWRSMFAGGGRRIMRALPIDAATVGPLTPAQHAHWAKSPLMESFFQTAPPVYTNLAAFRAYALAYLQAHPGIHQPPAMILMVRVQEPTACGIPLQVYAFTVATAWVDYEATQGEIIDHLIAMLPQFGLALYQRSSDYSSRQKDAAPSPAPV